MKSFSGSALIHSVLTELLKSEVVDSSKQAIPEQLGTSLSILELLNVNRVCNMALV